MRAIALKGTLEPTLAELEAAEDFRDEQRWQQQKQRYMRGQHWAAAAPVARDCKRFDPVTDSLTRCACGAGLSRHTTEQIRGWIAVIRNKGRKGTD